MDPEQIPDPNADLKLKNALQLLAVLVYRSGGEVVIKKEEFDSFEGAIVKAKQLTPEYLELHVDDEECPGCDVCGGPTV